MTLVLWMRFVVLFALMILAGGLLWASVTGRE
jgi:hypothetical protein